jgi:2-dehydro-3-deoxygluconokinase
VIAQGPVVCCGENLLRFSAPAHKVPLQSPRLSLCVGGAKDNVAVSLARLGTAARMASVLPGNAMGRWARDELRRHGVDTGAVRFAPGWMGLYFLAAGFLHGLRGGAGERAALDFGFAAACLKHTIPCDFNLVAEGDVKAFLNQGGPGVCR